MFSTKYAIFVSFSITNCLDMNRILAFLSLVLVCFVAEGQDYEVAPVSLEFTAEPATSQTKTVSVRNHSSKKTSYLVTIVDFLPSQFGENKVLPPNSTKNSCANWITINPSFFEIAPGGDINLQITMMVPGEEYKTAWCTIYIQPSKEQTSWNSDKSVGTGVTVTGRIGVNIYQSPGSIKNQEVLVSNFQEMTAGAGDRKFSATIENTGDRITPCKVFLMASNLNTGEERSFEPQNIVVFPKMSRNLEFELPSSLAPGMYSIAALVDYGPKFPLAGSQLVVEIK